MHFQFVNKNYRIISPRGQTAWVNFRLFFSSRCHTCMGKVDYYYKHFFKESNSLQQICYLTLITPIYTVADYNVTAFAWAK